jgi:hypothetical protein
MILSFSTVLELAFDKDCGRFVHEQRPQRMTRPSENTAERA